jgi:hypothetical protein
LVLQADYAEFLNEVGMEGRVIHVASLDENGDIQCARDALALAARPSRHFGSGAGR